MAYGNLLLIKIFKFGFMYFIKNIKAFPKYA